MKPIEERIEDFRKTLEPFEEIYGLKMIEDFFEYWTETLKQKKRIKNKKFRQEKETSWTLSRRLKTWKANDEKWNPKTNNRTYDRFANLENIAKGILEGGH